MDTTRIDLLSLAGRYTKLKKVAGTGGNCGIIGGVNRHSRTGVTSTGPAANHERSELSMATSDSTPLKRCSKCGVEYPATLEYFYAQTKGKYGIRSRCKSCMLAENAAWEKANPYKRAVIKRRSRINTRTSRALYYREYRLRNPEYHKTRKKAWRENNPEHVLEYSKRYRIEKRDSALRATRNWVKNHPEAARVNWRRRDERLKQAEGSHTARDILRIYTEQDGRCLYCGITLHDEYHVDHIYPLALGGSNNPDNIALACPFCNMSKGHKTLAEWQQARGW